MCAYDTHQFIYINMASINFLICRTYQFVTGYTRFDVDVPATLVMQAIHYIIFYKKSCLNKQQFLQMLSPFYSKYKYFWDSKDCLDPY
jgi:hypothetical protein